MMKKGEISNNILAVLVIVAIAIGLVSIALPNAKFTGYANEHPTDSGYLNLSIDAITSINFTTNTIDFGTGQVKVAADATTCTLASNGTKSDGCEGFVGGGTSQGFVIENTGNEDVSLTITSGKTASTLIGGTSPAYQYKSSGAACATPVTSFTSLTGGADAVCSNLTKINAGDTATIDIQVVIPTDSKTGALSDTLTATATAL